MKKWAVAAILYVLVVIGGYEVYAQFFAAEDSPAEVEHDGSHEGKKAAEH
ncbi:hypothetical protein [Bacillus sp. T33-2]|nr:hypothetical protein [Bacillus sp. T33-2]